MASNSSGLQPRAASGLNASGRYVRISASGGDGSYALSEVQIFASAPSVFPPRVTELTGVPFSQQARDKTLLFGLSLIVAVVLCFRGAKSRWVLAWLAWPLFAVYQWVEAILEAWPLESREVSLIRGVLASIAAVAVLREAFGPTRFPASRTVVLSALALCGALSFLAFYNMGHPQFWDHRRHEATFVHHLDLRQYYPTAKYFRELGYVGLYDADVAAYAENNSIVGLGSLDTMPLRNLDDLKMSTVAKERPKIERIRSRFSAERWESYKRDSAYFQNVMGTPHYLETMHDMGGNATPVWMSIAAVLFNAVDASNEAFLCLAALDPLLLLAMFVAIWRTFGLRTMLVCLVIFGCNEFIMFGTNWAGATLRHDWLACLGLGACALRRERWLLGGALLAASSMTRAFPALAVIAATFPMFWWVIEYAKRERKLPGIGLIRQNHRGLERMLLGAAITTLALFAFSAVVLPISSWSDWLLKVEHLTSEPHGNHISLRSLIAGWEDHQASVLRARLPLYLTCMVAFIGMVFVACRGKRLEQAATLGLILVPVLFYPANYYIHFVFLLPLVIVERSDTANPKSPLLRPFSALDAAIVSLLLVMCAAQYWTVLVTTRPLHFYFATVILFATLTLLLFLLVRVQAVASGWFAPEAALAVRIPAKELQATGAGRRGGGSKRGRAANRAGRDRVS